jgi:hypothetical protein
MIPTAPSLQRRTRRLKRASLSLNAALKRMRNGELLLLAYSDSGAKWSFAGRPVTTEVAQLLIQHAGVCARGDSLFGPSQSYSWQGWAPQL